MATVAQEKPLSIAVLLGSVRRDRMCPRAAALVTRELERRGHIVHLVDPLELQLPLLDRMYKEYTAGEAPEPLQRLAKLYRGVDGFLIVSGEYNHGIPPALKNLLDHFLEEYFWRPSRIVCYSAGGFGGVRGAMQLRMTLAELGMPSISSLLPIPRIAASLDEDGRAAEPSTEQAMNRFLDEFLWHARALAAARAGGTPYLSGDTPRASTLCPIAIFPDPANARQLACIQKGDWPCAVSSRRSIRHSSPFCSSPDRRRWFRRRSHRPIPRWPSPPPMPTA